jgi:hypothetical protein
MKWAPLIAVLAAAAAAGAVVLYRAAIERDLADIEARLVSDAQLGHPDDTETASAINRAPAQCERVFDLRADRIAYALKGAELDALWERCQRIADIAAGLDKSVRQPVP